MSSSSPAEPARTTVPRWVTDFGPLLCFFAAYKLRGIYAATGAFMVAVTAALAIVWLQERKVAVMAVVTAVIVLVFGGLTLALGDARFIYVKPTAVAGLSALVLLGGLAFGRPLLKPLLAEVFQLEEPGWRALSLRFALFSLLLAGLNEVVWRSVTPAHEQLWVYFKFLGIPGLTLVFFATQAPLLKRFAIAAVPREGQADTDRSA